MSRCARVLPRDLLLTSVALLYFVLGYLLGVVPRMLLAMLRWRGQERRWRLQRLLSGFLRGFFWIIVRLGRPTTVEVSPEVRQLRGRVLICNHQSYLDPLLFIATFERHSTAAKPVWFRVPVFASLLRALGYLAPTGKGTSLDALSARISQMREHLASGGILFLFPEGRRTRDGSIGRFRPGAFKLALHLGVDVELLKVQGTAALFPPGCALFRTGSRAHIRLEHLGRITAQELSEARSRHDLAHEVAARYAPAPAPPEGDAT